MMTDEANQALAVLRTFTYARHTDLSARTMNNHDATALVLLHMGIARQPEIRDVLLTWRFGNCEYTTTSFTGQYWDSRRGTHVHGTVKKKHWKRHYTYLFNAETGNGYNFIAPSIAGAVVTMRDWQGTREWQRRQLWYRPFSAHYAITVEGIKRLRELGLTDTV